MIRYGPGGITAADFDNDGLYDLFVPDGVASRLFRNTGDGRFADVTATAGLAGLDGVSVGLFADVDGDGWRDLFVSRTFRPNQLFLSRGRDAAGQVRFASAAGAAHARHACRRLRRRAPSARIMVGLWSGGLANNKSADAAAGLSADLVATSLAQAVEQVEALAVAAPRA